MSRPLRIEYPGALYHVIARGNERREIFRGDADRQLYLKLLARYQKRFGFRIYAYCLMTNHVHLALGTGEIPLSRIVLAFHGCYAQEFNRRHDRVGHLFQGRYKALLVQKSPYLLALVRYIHENPVRASMTDAPYRYQWSSDHFFRGRRAPPWLDTDSVLGLLSPDRTTALREYVAFMARDVASLYPDLPIHRGVVKGDEEFARGTLSRVPDPDQPVVQSVERIVEVVAAHHGLSRDAMRLRVRRPDVARARAMVAYIARAFAKIPHARTAEFFRRDPSTLVRDAARIEKEIALNPKLSGAVDAVLGFLRSNA